jgi:thioredoxin reductase (NADPH)
MSQYDLIIIGSGLGGLTAGLFGARQGLSTLILESNVPGGHLISIEKIEDFPGFPDGIAGYDICPTVQRQAADHGAEFQRAQVLALQSQDRLWSVVTDEESHVAKAVVMASGSSLKELGVPGEAKLMGHGVSHCASCDGPLYRGQVVGVVGGGDSALQEALALTQYADQVVIFDIAENFIGQQSYRKRASENAKITARHESVVEALLGEEVLVGVRTRDLRTGQVSQVNLAGLFVYVGMRPNTAFVKDILRLSETGHVRTDEWMATERPGLYAVGDIRQNSARQAVTAAGDGATAAIAAYRYIKDTFGG